MFKIGAIGAGHMGMAVLDALVSQNQVKPADILVFELDERCRRQAKTRGFAAAGNESEVYTNAQMLLLAVPPQACEKLFDKLSRSAQRQRQKPIIISIMAGISSNYIRMHLGQETAVITVMPTISMRAGHGAATISYTANVPTDALSFVVEIFSATGEAVIVDEPMIKEVVAVNGCMPGYALYILDAFAREAETKGLDYRTAVRLIARGFAGVAALVLEEADPRELLSQVCTPGGLTSQGIASFEQNQLSKILAAGMQSSTQRCHELAR